MKTGQQLLDEVTGRIRELSVAGVLDSYRARGDDGGDVED